MPGLAIAWRLGLAVASNRDKTSQKAAIGTELPESLVLAKFLADGRPAASYLKPRFTGTSSLGAQAKATASIQSIGATL